MELRKMIVRPLATLLFLVLILVLPWWAALICVVLYALVFRNAVEAIVGAVCIVSLYMTLPGEPLWIGYAVIIFIAIVVHVVDKLKFRLSIFDHV